MGWWIGYKGFLYVEDFCDALFHVYKKFKKFDIVNICSGKSIVLKKVIKIIAKENNVKMNQLSYDNSMPTMIPIRRMSKKKLENKYIYKINTNLNEALAKTIIWYKKNKFIYNKF